MTMRLARGDGVTTISVQRPDSIQKQQRRQQNTHHTDQAMQSRTSSNGAPPIGTSHVCTPNV